MSRLFDELLRVRDLDAGFLSPKYEECLDAFLLPDMKAAVERIKLVVSRGEKVLIYGDYDVDGVTASTVMYDTLRLAGVKEIEIMLPNRFTDGYGMSTKVVQKAEETGVGLVITVDCGSRNREIIEQLNGIGVDVIVTDHHECSWDSPFSAISSLDSAVRGSGASSPAPLRASNLPRTSSKMANPSELKPRAIAIVNPKRKDWPCEDVSAMNELRELAGVGVAFKVAQALVSEGMIPDGQEKWLLDLVLIGTVCDSMVLRGENRRLCFYGLKVLEKTRRPGLKELMREAGVKRLDTEAIGFQIGPRLNAAGRMKTAEEALNLLMAEKKTVAARLALELEELNRARKAEQGRATAEVKDRGVSEEPVIIECGDWHEGVLGIIAGRLVEEYQRPAFALAEINGELKGSGRSFGEFNLAEALNVCQKYIIGGGGHAGACGVKLEQGKLGEFRQAINEYYRGLKLENQERFLGVREDLVVQDFEALSLELIEEMKRLEPYGEGNAEPVFLLPEARVIEVTKMGADEAHLRLLVWDQRGKSLKLMRFFAPEEDFRVREGVMANIWINLVENEYRGIRSVEGRILKLTLL